MRPILLVFALSALAFHGSTLPAAAGLAEAGELNAARANARAGGPVSERDAELLERWGCTSGTDNPVCKRQSRHYREYHRRRPRPDR